MAKPLPIEIVNYINRGLAERPRFFRLLSEHNNYVDPETTCKFYQGLVDMIKQELRENGVIRLPEIGDFVLLKQKAHIGWVGKVQRMIPESTTLKFIPKEALRDHFKALEKKNLPIYPVKAELRQEYGVEE